METKRAKRNTIPKGLKIAMATSLALGICLLVYLAIRYNPYGWINAYTSDDGKPLTQEQKESALDHLESQNVTEWRFAYEESTIQIRYKDREKPSSQKNFRTLSQLNQNEPQKLGISKGKHTGYTFLFMSAGVNVETIQIDGVALNDKGTSKTSPPLRPGENWEFFKEQGARYRFEVRVMEGTASGRDIDSISIEMLPFGEKN